MKTQRSKDADRIRQAYDEAIKAVARVGYLLRTTEAGRYMWADRHKTAMSGMKATLTICKYAVPYHNEEDMFSQNTEGEG